MAPGQVISVEQQEEFKPEGFALVFYPDLIRGTSLGQSMDYSFFRMMFMKLYVLKRKS